MAVVEVGKPQRPTQSQLTPPAVVFIVSPRGSPADESANTFTD